MNEIKVEIGGKVAVVTLDRPPVHALTTAMYERLSDIFETLGTKQEAHCAILTSSGGKAFCAGKDLHEFLAAKVEDDPAAALVIRRAFSAIRNCEIPVVAAVNGAALGAGCVIAACCDIRIASENATFGLPEINVGRCGGGSHLGRLIPQGALRRMFFTGQAVTAAEAYRLGLVDQLTSAEGLMPAAMSLAETIAAKSPLGLRLGKKALNVVEALPLEQGYPVEQAYSTKLMRTEDAREATRAVVEKRKPIFQGR